MCAKCGCKSKKKPAKKAKKVKKGKKIAFVDLFKENE